MRAKKEKWFKLRIDPLHKAKLQLLADQSGLSMSQVMRQLIDGAAIREMPPADYHKMVGELNAIGNNMNQIARAANGMDMIDRELFAREAAHLRTVTLNIRRAVELR